MLRLFVRLPPSILLRSGGCLSAFLVAKHAGPVRWTNGKAKVGIKGADVFGGHQSNERSWQGMLFQIRQDRLHQAISQPFALKGWQHDDVLQIKIQSSISDDPPTADDLVMVQQADREQGIGQSSGSHLFVKPPPADPFTQSEILFH